MLSTKQLERIVKGFANHRRIEILLLLKKRPEMSLGKISDTLNINLKTAHEHVQRLNRAGLILKRYEGATVRHKVSPLGNTILKFLRILE